MPSDKLELEAALDVEGLLKQLQLCTTGAEEAFPQRAELGASIAQLASQLQTRHPDSDAAGQLASLAEALGAAEDAAALAVAGARGLRLVMQASSLLTPVEPEPVVPSHVARKERRAKAAKRRQRAAIADAEASEREGTLDARDAPVESLPGIGAVTGQALRSRGLATLGELLWLLPLAYRDERRITPFSELVEGEHAVTAGHVVSARGGGGRGRGGRMADVVLRDAAGDELRLVWFRAPGGLAARFREGQCFTAAGRVESFRGRLGINHPVTAQVPEGQQPTGPGIVPRYSEVPGVGTRTLQRAVHAAVERAAAALPDAVPASVRAAEGLDTLQVSLRALHHPPQDLDAEALAAWNAHGSEPHRRLVYEEFFLLELALHHRRVEEQGARSEALEAPDAPMERARRALGFALTGAQERVVSEIGSDLRRQEPMRRLLQGDVGSGKTAVALLSAAQAVAAGAQVAFMAPTEVLAEQHFRGLGPLSEALGLKSALLVGGARSAHRKQVLKQLESGALDLVVGTHALLSDSVTFARLRLVIVDEQHRFGVAQRLRLVDKGGGLAPHLLVMTATPIPRTLTLALHGDLAVSVLDEMPPGRVPPVTRAYPASERERALRQLERALESGGQAYVVCPAIEEHEEQPLRTVEEAYRELSERFSAWGVELLHGRLPQADKQAAMERFASGQAKVLVATTVIEVGVDVSAANLMLIEHAERFGLAQLHQLRGRVGRGGQRSACLLVHEAVGDDANARIAALCDSHDGFVIAEQDLTLRGPGELFGRRQSGLPGFRFGDLRRDVALLERAQLQAAEVVSADPDLTRPEHAGARAALLRLQDSRHAVVKEEAG